MKKRKLVICTISFALIVVTLALGLTIAHSYKHQSFVQPEDLHLRGDGVYFNVFTEDTRNETASTIVDIQSIPLMKEQKQTALFVT